MHRIDIRLLKSKYLNLFENLYQYEVPEGLKECSHQNELENPTKGLNGLFARDFDHQKTWRAMQTN